MKYFSQLFQKTFFLHFMQIPEKQNIIKLLSAELTLSMVKIKLETIS